MIIQEYPSPISLDRKEALEDTGFRWQVIGKSKKVEKSKYTGGKRKDPGLEVEEEKKKKKWEGCSLYES